MEGGSTRPWKVLVLAEGKPIPYVVKNFQTNTITSSQSVAREVFGNALASALDLNVPDPALILYNDDFLSTLSKDDLDFIRLRDDRVKFGCKFIEGSVAFTATTPRSIIEKYEAENIFAFDNLIFNVDRRVNKPNILLLDKGYFLIDHELSLAINLQSIRNFESEHSIYTFRNHVFFNHLRKAQKANKSNYFETFEEILRYLRPEDVLTPLKNQLSNYNHPCGEFDILIEYLELARRKSGLLMTILKNQVG